MNVLSKLPGRFFYASCYATVFGGASFLSAQGIGYLGAHVFKHIQHVDSTGALICGAFAGATSSLFLNPKSDIVTRIAGVAVLAIAPYSLCQLLQMTLSIHAIALVTVISTACAVLFQQWREEEERNGQQPNTVNAPQNQPAVGKNNVSAAEPKAKSTVTPSSPSGAAATDTATESVTEAAPTTQKSTDDKTTDVKSTDDKTTDDKSTDSKPANDKTTEPADKDESRAEPVAAPKAPPPPPPAATKTQPQPKKAESQPPKGKSAPVKTPTTSTDEESNVYAAGRAKLNKVAPQGKK